MQLATVEKIISKQPIENADKIELAGILGWEVVIKKDEYQIGDLCIYIPIDVELDLTQPHFAFLKNKEKNTLVITTKKIRGAYSQGITLPLSSLKDYQNYKEGDDVAEVLGGITKYEKKSCDDVSIKFNSQKVDNFPHNIISKTDEPNLKSHIRALAEILNEEAYISFKMDGSSMTVIGKKNENSIFEFTVCSRNFVVAEDSPYYLCAENIFPYFTKNLAIQGELCGPKVNGNRLGLTEFKFYAFNIKLLDENRTLNFNEFKEICNLMRIEHVPILDIIKIDENWTISKFQEYANEVKYNVKDRKGNKEKKIPGEGIVVRTTTVKYSNCLRKKWSVKIINQNYKDEIN